MNRQIKNYYLQTPILNGNFSSRTLAFNQISNDRVLLSSFDRTFIESNQILTNHI